MRVICAGPRDADWTIYPAIRGRLAELPPGSIVAHGACGVSLASAEHTAFVAKALRGVDAMVDRAARELGLTVEWHPADWDHWKARGNIGAAGPVRNRQMASLGADLCLIWWFGEASCHRHRGTCSMRAAAKAKQIPVETRLLTF